MPSKRNSPLGLCSLCGRVYSKASMVRHLRKHLQARQGDTPLVWLRVTDATPWAVLPSQAFWLDLEVPLDLPLVDLDDFLRAVWVECCGHLSHFVATYQGATIYFEVHPEEPIPTKEDLEKEFRLDRDSITDPSAPLWVRFAQAFPGPGGAEMPANLFTVGDLAQVVDRFVYEYDFGTTSRLNLQVQARYTGPRPEGKPAIRVLSRNFKPRIPCDVCDKPAEFLAVDDEGYYQALCKQHADEAYDKGEAEYLYPLVNSPRTGLCGYEGPYEAKWKFEVLPPE